MNIKNPNNIVDNLIANQKLSAKQVAKLEPNISYTYQLIKFFPHHISELAMWRTFDDDSLLITDMHYVKIVIFRLKKRIPRMLVDRLLCRRSLMTSVMLWCKLESYQIDTIIEVADAHHNNMYFYGYAYNVPDIIQVADILLGEGLITSRQVDRVIHKCLSLGVDIGLVIGLLTIHEVMTEDRKIEIESCQTYREQRHGYFPYPESRDAFFREQLFLQNRIQVPAPRFIEY